MITVIPKTKEQQSLLSTALLRARHYNIRLIIPKYKYPSYIRCNIHNDF